MSLSALTANIEARLNWNAQRSNGSAFAASKFIDAIQRTTAFTFGTGSNQVNQIFTDQRTVTPATPTDDIDLLGVLSNVFGETVSFSAIKAAYIYNRAETAGENLEVGNASTHPWNTPFKASNDEDLLHPSGIWLRTAPIAGFAVTHLADTLRILHAGISEDITFDLILLGVE